MKVALITRHAIANYGSLLQAYATQKAIEKLGHESIVIDYIRKDESYRYRELTLLRKKPQWYNHIIKRILYLVLRQPESILAGKKFEKMQAQFLKRTKRYQEYSELEASTPQADVYMTGSDQVWGPTEDGSYDKAYCLEFIRDRKKVSYASSFGRTEISEEQSKKFAEYFKNYSVLSVRENSAASILKVMGFNAYRVLDPTLLLTADEWSSYAKEIKEHKYILVYQLHNDAKLSKYAKKVSRETGLPLIRISATLHQCFRGGKFIYLPDVSEFLGYIKNAECMITDSFHGTAFAINFNTPFIEILPNNHTGTRNVSILEKTGLLNRILEDFNDLSIVREKADFSYANEILSKERTKSIEILRKMIEE